MVERQTAKSLYQKLEIYRRPYLDRARKAAELTIPSLIPKEGSNGNTQFVTPYQGVGARGVNHLTAKLLLALLPPNSPFFRLTISDQAMAALSQGQAVRAKVEEALGSYERTVMGYIESSNIRPTTSESIKHLVVAGNVLLFLPPEGGMRLFPLSSYVVRRDPIGNVLDIVTREQVAIAALPPEIAGRIKGGKEKTPETPVDIYTHVTRDPKGGQWTAYQEVEGEIIKGTENTYPLDKTPWMALRFTKVDGEHYGRGFVEELIGDLMTLEATTQAIVEGSAISAKVIFLVNPNGVTKAHKLAKAENGAFVEGDISDVEALQVQKASDLRVAQDLIRTVTERLSFAFMLNSAIQRNGERVTAEEIRYMASELEDTLGGIYSILSQEFQLPLVRRLMVQMQSQKLLPELPKQAVNPMITTGMEALGRGHDLNRLNAFMQQLAPLGPALNEYLNMSDYITRVGTALGLDMKGLVRAEEEVAQARQQAQMAAMTQSAAPHAVKAMIDNATKAAEGQQQ